ncbi:MAG: Uma2 family endonuclease [Candidatus Xenobia bacterium]
MAVQSARGVGEDRILLHTDWKGYLKILSVLGEHRGGIRVIYDRGNLELMTTSDEHGHVAALLATLLRESMQHHRIRYRLGGIQTLKRKGLDRGTEPDDCFWVANSQRMVGVKRWYPHLHPPPDVAVEVTITHGFLSRIPIYAALGVPEVWHFVDGKVQILRLSETGEYLTVEVSQALPQLPADVVARHLALANEMLDSDVVDRFREWLSTSHAG